jgi:hypothetical protein
MINKAFEGRLTKFGSKTTKENEVITEFVITHQETTEFPDFLDSLSTVFHNDISKCMEFPEWKSIAFDVESVNVSMNFDDDRITLPCELKGLRISKRYKPDGDCLYTFNLIFNKILNPATDSSFAATYLNRKDEDEETGKTVTMKYDVILTK